MECYNVKKGKSSHLFNRTPMIQRMALLPDNGLFYLTYGIMLTLRLKSFKNLVFKFYFSISLRMATPPNTALHID